MCQRHQKPGLHDQLSVARIGLSLAASLCLWVTEVAIAFAHPGVPPAPHDLARAWNWQPSIVMGLVLAAWLYAGGVRTMWQRAGGGHGVTRRQALAYSGGLLALCVALVSPLDALGTALFSGHMVQHLVLILIAAPLLVLGKPLLPLLWTLPRAWRRALGRSMRRPALRTGWHLIANPLVASVIHFSAVWIWHLPAFFQAALHNEIVHAVEHLSFLITALLWWWVVIESQAQRGLGYGVSLLAIFAATVQSGVLGALLTFTDRPWYPAYGAAGVAWGLTPLEDQQLAGVVMWVPAGVVYLVAAVILFVRWFGALERHMQRRESLAEQVGRRDHQDTDRSIREEVPADVAHSL